MSGTTADSTGRGAFPSTHWSVLKPVPGEDETTEARRGALEALARLSWKPIDSPEALQQELDSLFGGE